jgi:hypothetical protein
MGKDPAFLFYPEKFLMGTILMSDDQIGKYIKLLCVEHQLGHLTEKDMLKICLTYDEDIFCKFEKDEGGLYYNERLEREINRRKEYSISRSKNRKQADASHLEGNGAEEDCDDMKDTSSSYEDHSITITKTITTNVNKKEKGLREKEAFDFEQFWRQYPKKVGKKDALESWGKLNPSPELIEKIIYAVSKQSMSAQWTKDGGQFIPNPSTWLNQGRWDDELPQQTGLLNRGRMSEAERIMSIVNSHEEEPFL